MSAPLAGVILFPLGLPELLVIAGVIVLVFGATKLPKLGKGLGEGIRNFKNGLKGEDEPGALQDGKKVGEKDEADGESK